MSLEIGRYRLMTAHKTLLERWEDARLVWHDSVRASLAETIWNRSRRS